MTTVKDRYTVSHERKELTCPSCGEKDVAYVIHNGDDIECPKCYVAPEKPRLGELTDKYIREGLSEDDAFRQAQEDRL